ncbi:hypothetical protein FACS189496_5240 [Bacilli bacterium]|nr:hypothetical protein FACS189496_5240 [Bacilli bacterium]
MVSELGGEEIECVGFAYGIERIMELIKNDTKQEKNLVVIIPLTTNAKELSFSIMKQLRENNIGCLTKFDINKITKGFSYAESVNAKYIIIIGEEEVKTNILTVKNEITHVEEKINVSNLINYFNKNV